MELSLFGFMQLFLENTSTEPMLIKTKFKFIRSFCSDAGQEWKKNNKKQENKEYWRKLPNFSLFNSSYLNKREEKPAMLVFAKHEFPCYPCVERVLYVFRVWARREERTLFAFLFQVLYMFDFVKNQTEWTKPPFYRSRLLTKFPTDIPQGSIKFVWYHTVRVNSP